MSPLKIVVAVLLITGLIFSPSNAADDTSQRPAELRNPRDSKIPLVERLSPDTHTRILELIYVLRYYRVFERDDEMASAVRELIRIGPPALPQLIAELDRTDRGQTISALGITLRGMKDYRAVHALIRNIPKTLRRPGSDCGIRIRDPELLQFMLTLERYPVQKEAKNPSVSMGRPVNEILGTLEKLTGFLPPEKNRDSLRYVFLSDDPQQQQEQQKLFHVRMDLWRAWWANNHAQFLTEEEYQQFRDPTPAAVLTDGLDEVERAGEARFGPLFPSGTKMQLGPIHEVELMSLSFVDAPCAIDFDRRRKYRVYEGAAPGKVRLFDWDYDTGIDYTLGSDGGDLHVWTIDQNRWDTLDEEIRSGKRLNRGVETSGGLFANHPPAVDTFLFLTREGGMGVLRLEPYRKETSSRIVKYRMWTTGPEAPDTVTPPTSEQPTGWGEVVKVRLPVVGSGTKSFWSIKNSATIELPIEMTTAEIKNQLYARNRTSALLDWSRGQAINFFPLWTTLGSIGGPPDPEKPSKRLELYYFDSLLAQVRPQAFDKMSADTALMYLTETGERDEPRSGSIFYANEPRPCHLFMTADGKTGILQITQVDREAGVIEFQYKLKADQ